MNNTSSVLYGLALLALSVGWTAAHAADEPMTAERAAEIVKQRTGGRILAAESESIDGCVLYRVKVYTKGHVRVVYVDPDQCRR